MTEDERARNRDEIRREILDDVEAFLAMNDTDQGFTEAGLAAYVRYDGYTEQDAVRTCKQLAEQMRIHRQAGRWVTGPPSPPSSVDQLP